VNMSWDTIPLSREMSYLKEAGMQLNLM